MPFPVIFFKRCFIGVVCGSEHVEGHGSELNSVKLGNRPPDPNQIWRNQVHILDCDRAIENLERKLEEQSERDLQEVDSCSLTE